MMLQFYLFGILGIQRTKLNIHFPFSVLFIIFSEDNIC